MQKNTMVTSRRLNRPNDFSQFKVGQNKAIPLMEYIQANPLVCS